MKRFLVFFLLLMLAISLCACSKGSDPAPGGFTPPENYATVVTITINPQFRLYLDAEGQVLAVEPVNDDAKSIAEKVASTGDLETVVEKITVAAKDGGFVTESATVKIQITEIRDASVDTEAILEKAESSALVSFEDMQIEADVETSVSPDAENNDYIDPSDPTNPSIPSEPTVPSEPTNPSEPAPGDGTHTHSYTATVTAPTAAKQGYTTHTCACGDSYTDTYTNLDGTTHKSGTLVFSPDGIARLYSANNKVSKTYTGWDTATYETTGADGKNNCPWYGDRKKISAVIIEDDVSPNSTFLWFLNHTNLTSITIGNGVTTLDERMMQLCTSLTQVTLKNGLSNIGPEAFSSCTKLKSITLPDSVVSIGRGAFGYCKNLTSITLPENLVSIGNDAFTYCTSLKKITIPSGVETIGGGAFSACEELTSITIPNSVVSMGGGIFSWCTKLESMTLPNCEINFSGMFSHCTSLTSVTIPAGIDFINSSSFEYCTSLTSITFAGTKSQWKNILYNRDWNDTIPATYVQCSDGTVELE